MSTSVQRAKFDIMPMGIHCLDLDEDLSIAGMLRRRRAPASGA